MSGTEECLVASNRARRRLTMGRAKRFRVLVAKDDRAIAGLSMGGGHTLAATNNNREIPGRHYWFLWRDFLAQYAQVMFQ